MSCNGGRDAGILGFYLEEEKKQNRFVWKFGNAMTNRRQMLQAEMFLLTEDFSLKKKNEIRTPEEKHLKLYSLSTHEAEDELMGKPQFCSLQH